MQKNKLAGEIYSSIERTWDLLQKKLSGDRVPLIELSRLYEQELLKERVLCALAPFESSYKYWDNLFSTMGISGRIADKVKSIFHCDLHKKPYKSLLLQQKLEKDLLFNENDRKFYLHNKGRQSKNDYLKIEERRKFLKSLTGSSYRRVPLGFIFFTRPFSELEITVLLPGWVNNQDFNIDTYINLFNCNWDVKSSSYESTSYKPSINSEEKLIDINIKSDNENLDRKFVLTSLETKNESWAAVVKDKTIEPDKDRYIRLFALINDILRCRAEKIDYVVFPELSIPRQLLIYIANSGQIDHPRPV